MTEKERGDTELRRTLVGKHRPPDGPNEDPAYHLLGFGIALQNALDDAKPLLFLEEDLGETGRTFDVSVSFEATVTVRNPGAIGEYRAMVTEP